MIEKLIDEDELIQKYQDGDKFILEDIFKINKPLINSIVRRYFLVGAEIEDLMQEGMIGLYNAVINYDKNKDANFKTYAKICIERAVINAIKSANSKKNLPLNSSVSINSVSQSKDEDEDNFVYNVFDKDNPESILLNKEKKYSLIEKAFQNLSVFEKEVLQLYLDGLSYIEIADKMDKTSKSIDNALTRIKSKIAQLEIKCDEV